VGKKLGGGNKKRNNRVGSRLREDRDFFGRSIKSSRLHDKKSITRKLARREVSGEPKKKRESPGSGRGDHGRGDGSIMED